jgi:lysophospholipase L1-like esterase
MVSISLTRLTLLAVFGFACASSASVPPTPDRVQDRRAAPIAQAHDSIPAPVVATAEQDHRHMMELLGITSLRPGPSGNPDAPNAANTDESKASPYTSLPDPLVLNNGERVTTAHQWWQARRPEIVEDFDREVYGRVPDNVPAVKWEVQSATREMNETMPVLVKQLVGRIDNSAYPLIDVEIDLTVVTPVEARAPVPVMMHFGFNFPPGMRPTAADGPTWQQQLLENGWGYAILIPTSYQADNGAGLTQGIIGLSNHGRPRKLDNWGALRAWAWGASRALDYLETDPAVNAEQVGIEGLSRYGKAALVAMAYEPRFAIGFIGSSGAGGAKILRRVFGEQVENLASSGEYHWFAGSFIKYAGPLTANDLPVDAHELIALCAPRPVFISVGSPAVEGQWIDARGMFLAGVHAGPVYRLLGQKGLGTDTMPPMETGLLDGEIAFRQHSGGHTTGPNWPTFLAYASRYTRTDSLAGTWVATWSTSVQLTEPRNLPPEPGLEGNTLRQVVHVSLGGDRLRVHFSNAFGTSPVTLTAAHLAASLGDGAIDPATDRALAFDGRPSVTIPASGGATSDSFSFGLQPLSDVAITVRFGAISPDTVTGHPGSRTTSYLVEGDAVSDPAMAGASRTDHWYIIAGIDIATDSASAVVALGNSITDGRGSGTNKQNRWPDELARRLKADDRTNRVAVLNAGIGGNCVLRACLGPSALARFERDVLQQPGVRWLIVLEGVNDIGTAAADSSAAVARGLIAAYQQMIDAAHARDILVYGATILPFGGSFYDSPEHEAARSTVNEWIRTSGAFDAVIDLDAALRDPSDPTHLLPAADTGDHLHPNEVGYRMMAEAVDLALFTR